MFKNYLFIDKISGEEFICQAEDLYTAKEILEGLIYYILTLFVS